MQPPPPQSSGGVCNIMQWLGTMSSSDSFETWLYEGKWKHNFSLLMTLYGKGTTMFSVSLIAQHHGPPTAFVVLSRQRFRTANYHRTIPPIPSGLCLHSRTLRGCDMHCLERSTPFQESFSGTWLLNPRHLSAPPRNTFMTCYVLLNPSSTTWKLQLLEHKCIASFWVYWAAYCIHKSSFPRVLQDRAPRLLQCTFRPTHM
jgi:hypothetical protein